MKGVANKYAINFSFTRGFTHGTSSGLTASGWQRVCFRISTSSFTFSTLAHIPMASKLQIQFEMKKFVQFSSCLGRSVQWVKVILQIIPLFSFSYSLSQMERVKHGWLKTKTTKITENKWYSPNKYRYRYIQLYRHNCW